jgi:ABC-type dipeptide/oligopeptide/nickel transport system permease subunit
VQEPRSGIRTRPPGGALEPADDRGTGRDQPAIDSSPIVGLSPWQIAWRSFRRDRLAVSGLIFIAILVVVALSAPLIARYVVHHGPNDLYVRQTISANGLPSGPSGDFWFGVDTAGRDVFVRVLYGARTSLIVAFAATGASVLLGVAIGLIAGFSRGLVDGALSRLMDFVLSLPALLLSLGLVSACGLRQQGCLFGLIRPGIMLVSLVIALFSWPYLGRIVRGQVLSLRQREFVEAAIALGSPPSRIAFREILPNVVAPIIVYTTLLIPNNILFEASLSFLGLGVPPSTPSWGQMLAQASSIFTVAWWMMLFPGLFLFFTTFAFNIVGDGLRDALSGRR